MGGLCFAQAPAETTNAPDNNKAGAYYNFAMGRLYAELAGAYTNRNDYVSKAIQHYQEALKLDPSAGIVFEELTDLYIQTNRLRDAVAQAEDLLKQNPDNLDARRMLGRIYTRMAGDSQAGKVNEDYLKLAIEQYQKVTAKDAKDAESWVVLGRLYRFDEQLGGRGKGVQRGHQGRPRQRRRAHRPGAVVLRRGGHAARHREIEGRHRQEPQRADAGPSSPVVPGASGLQERRRSARNGPWRWRPTIPA